jgi:hypothetical protein
MNLKAILLCLLVLLSASLACRAQAERWAPEIPTVGVLSPVETLVSTLEAPGIIPTLLEGGTLPVLPRLQERLTPQAGTSVPPNEAQLAIQTYAHDVLGLEIQVETGRDRLREMEIPLSAEDEIYTALELTGITYNGIWDRGMASLSFGEGTTVGELTADIENGSLGIFAIRLPEPYPENTEAALEMIRAAYPGLADLPFFVDDDFQDSYAFSTSKGEETSLQGGMITLKGSLITAGVSQARLKGASIVWVVVATGDLATPFQ